MATEEQMAQLLLMFQGLTTRMDQMEQTAAAATATAAATAATAAATAATAATDAAAARSRSPQPRAHAAGPSTMVVDTRIIGKPGMFAGTDEA